MIEKTGSTLFAELCSRLIDDEGIHYLHPEVSRTRQTDWMAFIFTSPNKDERELLAQGQADSMDGACKQCVTEYKTRQVKEVRKAELLKEPLVREALELFKGVK